MESAMLTLPALAYLLWLSRTGASTFTSEGPLHVVLLVLCGVATAVPQLLFAGAANRLPLTALVIIQYVAPTLQLAFGVLIYHEPMPPARIAGFALVWCALVVFTWDALRTAARTRRADATKKREEDYLLTS